MATYGPDPYGDLTAEVVVPRVAHKHQRKEYEIPDLCAYEIDIYTIILDSIIQYNK